MAFHQDIHFCQSAHLGPLLKRIERLRTKQVVTFHPVCQKSGTPFTVYDCFICRGNHTFITQERRIEHCGIQLVVNQLEIIIII